MKCKHLSHNEYSLILSISGECFRSIDKLIKNLIWKLWTETCSCTFSKEKICYIISVLQMNSGKHELNCSLIFLAWSFPTAIWIRQTCVKFAIPNAIEILIEVKRVIRCVQTKTNLLKWERKRDTIHSLHTMHTAHNLNAIDAFAHTITCDGVNSKIKWRRRRITRRTRNLQRFPDQDRCA